MIVPISFPRFRQISGDYLPLVQGTLFIPHLLVGLMAFASKYYYITFLSNVQSAVDRFHSIYNYFIICPARRNPCPDAANDGLRVLMAGVVAGENGNVRQTG